MMSKFKYKFFLLSSSYVFLILFGLLFLSFKWLPPGYTLAGHDSGLPLDADTFFLTRLYAWDNRLGFGIDNSANFGSLTIHFFDWLFATLGGTPYAGNYLSVFFWLGLVFLSGFIFAYQLRRVFGKPFVFLLPIFLTFNFYIFQSVFMLERAKFGIFSATLISLAVYFRMQKKKLPILAAAMIMSFVFTIFNGGGWFGVTLYAGVVLIFLVLFFVAFGNWVVGRGFGEARRAMLFFGLGTVFYLLFNAYSILPYLNNFLVRDASLLFEQTFTGNHAAWLQYLSRSTSFLNLFRFLGIPEWYMEPNEANLEHAYSYLYLNNRFVVTLSFLFPVISFGGFFIAKKRQRRVLGLFGLISLFGMVFAAGAHEPLGFLYVFAVEAIPGFFLLRSALYKFGVFYMLGMTVLFAFALSFFIDNLSGRLAVFVSRFKQGQLVWIRKSFVFVLTFSVLGAWLGYHSVLFDPNRVFSWKPDQSTRMQVPEYVYEFADWVEQNDLEDKRILLLPPFNEDWKSDVYSWGYWSLSPLPSVLVSEKSLSNWHALASGEVNWASRLYVSVEKNDEEEFFDIADRLDVGYVLVRHDVLADSSWSSAGLPESYSRSIESFNGVSRLAEFGEWDFYKLESMAPRMVYATRLTNVVPSNNLVSLVNELFSEEYTITSSESELYSEIETLNPRKLEVYGCVSCLLEREASLQSLPEATILPNSLLYYFKSNREKEVISQSKDPRDKIADYLGYILRRSAEVKKMLDLSVDEKYLLEGLKVIRQYLDMLYSEIGSSSENSYDFELLRQVLDFFSPIEREFGDYMDSSDFKAQGYEFREEMLGVRWRMDRVKDLFTPLLESPDRWSTEKRYKVNIAEFGKYTLFFYGESFPKDAQGNIILPKSIVFRKGGVARNLEVVVDADKDGWYKAELGQQVSGEGELVLSFEELPDLLNIEGSGLEDFDFGKGACYRGSIKGFDKSRKYQISISRTDFLSEVRIIFRDNSHKYSDKHGFLIGDDSFEVPALAGGEFTRHVYYPAPFTKDVSVYICSNDRDLPLISEIYVKELFAPSVVGVKEPLIDYSTPPEVEYTFVNPTRYEVTVRDAQSPYILLFNEKYNPFWELQVLGEEDMNFTNKHVYVDGYANGWFIDRVGTSKFKIEYTPQALFYKGRIISIGSLLMGLSLLLYYVVRSKRKSCNSREDGRL